MCMNSFVNALRWPAKPGNDLVPWFVVAWRTLWTPLVFVGLAIACAGVLFAFGWKAARYFWINGRNW